MSNVLNFPTPKANAEPIIYSDYWGDNFSLLELLEAIERSKNDRADPETKL